MYLKLRNVKKVLSVLGVFVAISVFGQTDCQELKVENETINKELVKVKGEKSVLFNRVSELEKQVVYFKEALNLLNTKDKLESEKIIYRINLVKGSLDNGTITIEGLIENKGAVKRFQGQVNVVVDAKGNSYKTYGMTLGGDTWIPKFQRNLPTKFSIVFKEIVDETPIIKSLSIKAYNRKTVVFKNLSVNWE